MEILLKVCEIITLLSAIIMIVFFFPVALRNLQKQLNQMHENIRSIFGALIAINMHTLSDDIAELESHIEEEIQNDNYEQASQLKDQVSVMKKALNEQREIFRKHFNGSTVKFQG